MLHCGKPSRAKTVRELKSIKPAVNPKVVIFTSLFFGGPLKDDYLWARAKTQGVAGARRYLELYPKGRSAGDAQVVVLKTERNVSLSVEERYVLLPNHSLGLVKPLSDMLLDSEMRNITVGVEVNGEPLHFSYRRRGKLYTGARLEAAAEVSLCNGNVRLREEFTAETLPPGSVLLKETDNGGKPETGTASIYSDITVFSSRK